MNVISASNPVWANAEHTAITLDVVFEGLGELPFTASPDDVEQHCRDLFVQAVGEAFGPPAPYVPPAIPVPPTISDRQFFQQLAVIGKISQAEAIAAVKTGTIPAVLQAFIDSLPDQNQRFSATMLLAGATIFERAHPLTNVIGSVQGLSPEQIDQFFIEASQL